MKISEKKRISLQTDKFFCWFIAWFWCTNTIMPFLVQIYKGLPLVGETYEYISGIVSLLLLLLSLPYMAKKIKAKDTLFYMGCAIVVLLTILLLPKNGKYISEQWYRILIISIPTYYIGIVYDHERLKKTLYYVSLVSVAVNLMYQVYKISSGQALISDNMDASYKILPSVIYLIYIFFEKVSLLNIAQVVMGLVLTISYGTRGPILAVLVYIVLSMYFKIVRAKSTLVRILFIVTSGLLLLLSSSSQMTQKIAKILAETFERVGFSTRIMDMFLIGEIADDAGRNVLAETIIKAIGEKPFFGHGLMGDRVILGRYVHNIILELLCDYGFVIGGMIILVLVVISVYALYINRNSSKMFFVLAMICMIYIKLCFSGSFVHEPYFYFTLGLCVGACRDKPQKFDNGGKQLEGCTH